MQTRALAQDAPASGGFAIVPDDEVELGRPTRAIYVGWGGTLEVELLSSETITFHNLPDGALLPVRARKVLEATTAASLVGLY
nr:hypothetical protein [Pelagibacterium limicola]